VKTILIAVPTLGFIESETFKSIWDLQVPVGYTVDFVPFISDQIEHVRNEISAWVLEKNFDYLFAVDSDIVLKPDTLERFLNHDVDMVSGLYIQRIPGRHTIEVMRNNEFGGVTHVPYEQICGQGLVPIDSCGFGCVLIKRRVLETVPMPHFIYQSSLNFAHTISEDVYFCMQARNHGVSIYADTDVICDHIGSWVFKVDTNIQPIANSPTTDQHIQNRLQFLSECPLLPIPHTDYLTTMRDQMSIEPKVIYDIGACVLHWTNSARKIWPAARYVAFEAMDEAEFLYQQHQVDYHIGFIGDKDGQTVVFYQNLENPGGNSRYRENSEFSINAEELFSDQLRVTKQSMTLDTVVQERGFPMPDLIKIDVQGSELDILRGATNTLAHCRDLILELQHVEYNKGAPLNQQVIDYLDSVGFRLVTPLFSNNGVDGDYHFTRK
jgi:FkbM family methyltransferase